jgi:gluconate 5-dehydrogenase
LSLDIKEAFLIFIRGLFMGSADIVPGVSGGTIALITGIYGHLIEAISNIKFGFLKPLIKWDLKGFFPNAECDYMESCFIRVIDRFHDEIADKYGVRTLAVRCDITDTEMVESAVDTVLKEFGRIDILINNAGTGGVTPAEDLTDDTFSNEIDIDLFGTFRMARSVAKKAMIPAKYGRIINIASMYGLVGNKIAPCSPYHAAKGGVVNLSRGLAAEWGKYGITVNTVCPGYFYTPLTQETLDSEFFQDYAHRVIPLERYGNEGELDTTVLFLSSPASAYVTGVALPVDGGYTCV